MNHGKVRRSAEATVCNAGSPAEYVLAEAVLALLDENAELRAEVKATIDFVQSARPGEFHFGAAKALEATVHPDGTVTT